MICKQEVRFCTNVTPKGNVQLCRDSQWRAADLISQTGQIGAALLLAWLKTVTSLFEV